MEILSSLIRQSQLKTIRPATTTHLFTCKIRLISATIT